MKRFVVCFFLWSIVDGVGKMEVNSNVHDVKSLSIVVELNVRRMTGALINKFA